MKYINRKLTIEKVSIQNIAKKYGTPAYCYSYNQIKSMSFKKQAKTSHTHRTAASSQNQRGP